MINHIQFPSNKIRNRIDSVFSGKLTISDRRVWATLMQRWWRHLLLIAVTVAGFQATPTFAQSYPSRPVRIVVPFGQGGGLDIIVRVIAQRLGEQLGQSVIAENRTGGGGIVGSEVVAKAPADGYTLLAVPISHAVNVSLVSRLPFNPLQDFAPVVQIASAPNILLIHPSVPVRTVGELVKLARARPGQLSFASSGNGTSTHLAAELLKMAANVDLLHIPYREGISVALSDLLSGQVSMYFGSLPVSMVHMRSGRLRGIGVTTKQRIAALPDMPTFAQSGLPDFEYLGWYGLLAPTGTPNGIIVQINKEVNGILKSASFSERLATDGAEPVGGSPTEFGAFIKSEVAKWAAVIKHARIKAE